MKLIFRAVVFLCGLAIFASLVAGGFVGHMLTKSNDMAEPTIFEIPRGVGALRVAHLLEQQDLIEDYRLFVLATRLQNNATSLRAGEFEVPPQASVMTILDTFMTANPVSYTVTIPEGLTVKQIAALLGDEEHLSGNLPDTLPPEGTLMPDTYQIHRGDTRADILARMQRAKKAFLKTAWPQRFDDLPFDTLKDALILASVVEKETAVASERPMVAGVFVNRLRKGMRLQADATVVYGVTEGLGHMQGKRLLRRHLETDGPHNTYTRAGLPETPIANAGRESIMAVLQPASHDYLYFVADGTGGHAFAKTYAEHKKNVAHWRSIR